MAWTTPRTWVTGELVTAAIGNAHWRDNFNATGVATVTTAGDIVYASGANAFTRLGIGTAGYHLRSTGSVPGWSNIGIVIPARLTAQVDATTTTLATITDFTVAIGASEVWFFQYNLYLSCAAAGGAKFAVDVPASATFRVSAIGHEGSDGGTENTATGTTDATAFYTRTNDDNFWFGWATVVNSTNAGNVSLQFAQNAASGTSSILVNSMQLAIRIS